MMQEGYYDTCRYFLKHKANSLAHIPLADLCAVHLSFVYICRIQGHQICSDASKLWKFHTFAMHNMLKLSGGIYI